jgi:phosphate-selective porin OprO/OprP
VDAAVESSGFLQLGRSASGSATYPTVNFGGFFQADAVWFSQDAASIATVGDVQDGADFRRARFSGSGDVAENISYFMEFDFALPGHPNFMDLYMDVSNLAGPGTLRMGQWRQPIGMDALTSVKELTFLERALPFAFLPFRQIGIGKFHGTDDGMATWAVSAIRFPTDVYGGNVGDNGGYGVVGRTTLVPWESGDGDRLVHFGFGYSFVDPSNDLVQIRNQPEIFVAEDGGSGLAPPGVLSAVPPFVDTGPIPTQNGQVFDLEAALLLDSLYFQSEVMFARVDQIAGPTANFWGAYAQVGYFLTGEVRAYNHAGGVFGRVVPREPYGRCGGRGAWEIAGRVSTIDLNDGGISGGRLTDLTFGVNWYLARNAKLQFNYIEAMLDRDDLDSNTGIFACRAQVDF